MSVPEAEALNECAICLYEYDGNALKPVKNDPSKSTTLDGKVIKRLECGHSYCADCIGGWMAAGHTCPLRCAEVDQEEPPPRPVPLRVRREPAEISAVSQRISLMILSLRDARVRGHRDDPAAQENRLAVADLRDEVEAIDDTLELQEIFLRVVQHTRPAQTLEELEGEMIEFGREINAAEFERLCDEEPVRIRRETGILARIGALFTGCFCGDR